MDGDCSSSPNGKDKYSLDELFFFSSEILSAVKDRSFPKYRKKLFNCYVNCSVKFIENEKNALTSRFKAMFSLFAFISQCRGSTAGHTTAPDKKQIGADNEEITEESLTIFKNKISLFLTKKEISKIRAVILDLQTNTYTKDEEYSVLPEPWAKKLAEEISHTFPAPKTEVLKTAVADSLNLFVPLLIKELRDMFISKVKPFGSKGNLLVVDLIYLENYFKDRHARTEAVSEFIAEVQGHFRPGLIPENTEHLREIQLK